MAMIYDLFPFFNELDLLEIRLNVLNDVVDRFVICEAPWTHSGKPKSLNFLAQQDRFSKFASKIIYLVAEEPPAYTPQEERDNPSARQLAWVRENWQRNQLVRGLADARDDDVIMLSDVDEIPDPCEVAKLRQPEGVVRLGMRFYNFFLNYRNYSVPDWPIGTQVCTYGTFKTEATYRGMVLDQFVPAAINQGATLSKLRMAPSRKVVADAGWHFSYCGGVSAVIEKLKSFSHTELNTSLMTDPEEVKKALTRGGDSALCRGYSFFAEPLNEDFPQYIVENQSKYSEWILPADRAYLRKTRLPRLVALMKGRMYRLMVKMIPKFLYPFALHVRSVLLRRRIGTSVSKS